MAKIGIVACLTELVGQVLIKGQERCPLPLNFERFGDHSIDLAPLVVTWTRQIIDVLSAEEVAALRCPSKSVVVIDLHCGSVVLFKLSRLSLCEAKSCISAQILEHCTKSLALVNPIVHRILSRNDQSSFVKLAFAFGDFALDDESLLEHEVPLRVVLLHKPVLRVFVHWHHVVGEGIRLVTTTFFKQVVALELLATIGTILILELTLICDK